MQKLTIKSNKELSNSVFLSLFNIGEAIKEGKFDFLDERESLLEHVHDAQVYLERIEQMAECNSVGIAEFAENELWQMYVMTEDEDAYELLDKWRLK